MAGSDVGREGRPPTFTKFEVRPQVSVAGAGSASCHWMLNWSSFRYLTGLPFLVAGEYFQFFAVSLTALS